MVEIRVLGPLEVVGDGGPIALAARKHRQLLAALVVAPEVVRPADALIDALWPQAPPRSADKLLQVYVSQLRKVLPPAITIRTSGAGYAINLDGARIDAVRFEELLDQARAAMSEGNASLASSTLRRALELWRGDAYADFADADFARAQAQRLDELRRLAMEERFAAELELGRHRSVLPELLVAAADNPLRERLQGQAMLALYRSGRQAQALDLYRTTRSSLVDELGVEPGDELRELHTLILRQDASLDRRLGVASPAIELPVPPNPLRGRERELGELHALLAHEDVRLVVLTGAGGSGKTRLAIEAARREAPRFADGVAFVPLATVREAEVIPAVVGGALGAPPVSDAPLEALAAHLRAREMLLVLDNFEQLRAAGPTLVWLLARAPQLKIAVTSRVVLHVSGEHVYPVDPLPADAAAELFVERARTVDPRLAPDAMESTTINALCDRLDRLPLAIELAAGHLRALTPAELLGRLGSRLPLLSDGPHDLPARQQTLRATLEWSFDQLDDQARRDLEVLSVFSGGCTVDAAAAVLDPGDDILSRLRVLLDHSLLARATTAGGSRFSMLETVRELAAERLALSGSAQEVRRRHAEYALRLAESCNLSIDALGTPAPMRYDIANVEQDNMRAALDWAHDADPLLGLALMAALEQFWVASSPRESVRRLTELLRAAGDVPAVVRARALRDLGGSSEVSGDWRAAGRYYQQSLDLFREIGDEAGELRLMHRVTLIAFVRGDLDTARAVTQDALVRATTGGFRYERCELLRSASVIAARSGDLARAYELERESLDLLLELGHWPWGENSRLRTMAEIASELGEHARAQQHGREALQAARRSGDRIKTVIALAALALIAARAGDLESAGRIWGAVETEEGRSFLGWWSTYRHRYADVLTACTGAEFDRGRTEGRKTSVDEVIEEVLGEQAPAS
ncbi:MAG TPA: BTAD domain-containing putative transcriptional regulator [Acidothermaceae bacterium]